MPRKGSKRRKTRTHALPPPPGAPGSVEVDKTPRCMVYKSKKVGKAVGELVLEMRGVMEPNVARNLRERSKNTMKDFAAVAGALGVSHLLSFGQTEKSVVARIARVPDGPTLTFKVTKYCLRAHVRTQQKRPIEASQAFKTPPLVVLNNFGDGGGEGMQHLKLMKITFQNMFPPINVAEVKLADCRRVVMFNYDKATGEVDMRHYAIRATPTDISKPIRKVVQAKIPNLRGLDDISEIVDGGYGAGAASDSEVEDEDSKVTLPERYGGRGNVKSQRSSIKLQELGPRLTLSLLKVERGVGAGDVLYHSYIAKTKEEVAQIKAKISTGESLKRKRREEQEQNVKRKEEAKEAKRAAKKAKYEARARGETGADADVEDSSSSSDSENNDDEYDQNHNIEEGESQSEDNDLGAHGNSMKDIEQEESDGESGSEQEEE